MESWAATLRDVLEVPGARYACVADPVTGAVVAAHGDPATRSDEPGRAGSPDGAAVAVLDWARVEDARTGFEDAMITTERAHHLVRAAPGASGRMLVYLLLDRSRGNLAVARRALSHWPGTTAAEPEPPPDDGVGDRHRTTPPAPAAPAPSQPEAASSGHTSPGPPPPRATSPRPTSPGPTSPGPRRTDPTAPGAARPVTALPGPTGPGTLASATTEPATPRPGGPGPTPPGAPVVDPPAPPSVTPAADPSVDPVDPAAPADPADPAGRTRTPPAVPARVTVPRQAPPPAAEQDPPIPVPLPRRSGGMSPAGTDPMGPDPAGTAPAAHDPGETPDGAVSAGDVTAAAPPGGRWADDVGTMARILKALRRLDWSQRPES